MITKLPVLTPNARLIRMRNCCALIDRFTGTYILLHPVSATIVAMCNGSISLDEIINICSKNLTENFDEAQDIVGKTIDKCQDFIRWGSERNESEWKYYPPDFLYEPEPKTDYPMCPLEKPLQMTLVLTNKCNLKCIYCFRDAGFKWDAELSKDEIFDLIDQAAQMELKYCSLTGGEPTMHPHFEEIVIRLLQKDIYPYISTNGICVSEETLSNLKEEGLETIQFSLDTGIREIYDKMVGIEGYFDKVINTIRISKRLGYYVRVKAVATKVNILNIESLFDICAENGVDFVLVEAFSPGLGGRGNEKLLLSHELALQVQSIVEKSIQNFSGKMVIAPFTIPSKWICPEDIIYCGGMYTSFIVQPDGTVCACEQVNEDALSFGNIRNQSLSDIWNSKQVVQFLNPDMTQVQEPCKSCEQFNRCRSGCFNYSLMYSDNLYSPDPRCWKIKLGKQDPLKLEE